MVHFRILITNKTISTKKKVKFYEPYTWITHFTGTKLKSCQIQTKFKIFKVILEKPIQSQEMFFYFLFFISGYSETDAISARIHVHPVNISFDPGDNVTLTCLVEQGGPADVIDWYKDDQPISSRVYSNSSRWTEISLINITREDAGKYECTVRKRDEKDTDVMQLHVNGI